MQTLGKYWQLFWYFRKLHLMRQLEYRGDFFFWSGVSVMWTVFNYFFFFLLANVNHGIGSWSVIEVYVVLSVFNIVDTFLWSFFYPNMGYYSSAIFSGELNQFLLKPVDTQFILMMRTNNYNNSTRFLIGISTLIWAIPQLEKPLTLATLGLFSYVLLMALLFLYLLWFCCSTLAFWVEKLDNINEIIPAIRRIWQLPREVYTGFLSTLLTVVFPIGLISALPSEVLVTTTPTSLIGYFTLFTLGLFIFSRWFFRFSLKRYVGQGD